MKKSILIIFVLLNIVNFSSGVDTRKLIVNQLMKGSRHWNKFRKKKNFNPEYYFDIFFFGGLKFTGSRFRNINLSHGRLYKCKFYNADFRYSNFYKAEIDESFLLNSNFSYCNFQNARFDNIHNIKNVYFNKSNMKYSIFSLHTKIRESDFSMVDMSHTKIENNVEFLSCNFFKANLRFVIFFKSDPLDKKRTLFKDCNFSHTDLRNIETLFRVDFKNCDFAYAKVNKNWYNYLKKQGVKNFDKIKWYPKFHNSLLEPSKLTLKYLKILKKGASFWNNWRKKNNYKKIIFKNKIIIKNLRFENFKFKNVSFSRVKFINCKFINSSFINSKLLFTYFVRCKINKSIFKKSKLEAVYIINSTLYNVKLNNSSKFYGSVFFFKSIIKNVYSINVSGDCNFNNCKLFNSVFKKSRLSLTNGTEFIKSKFYFSRFLWFSKNQKSILNSCVFKNVAIHHIKFYKIKILNSIFEKVLFIDVLFDLCDFKNVLFKNCSFKSFDFIKTDLNSTKFINVLIKKRNIHYKKRHNSIEKKWYKHLKKQKIKGFHLIKWR